MTLFLSNQLIIPLFNNYALLSGKLLRNNILGKSRKKYK